MSWHTYSQGVLLSPYRPTPTAHLFGATRQQDGKYQDFTLCGRRVSQYDVSLIMDHLDKFADRCKKCDKKARTELGDLA